MAADQFSESRVGQVETRELGNGIVVHRLWRDGPEASASRAVLVTFPAGSQWPGVDVHEPGPESVYIVEGTFQGLTGDGSEHHAGTFIHCAAGTSHAPSTATGGELFVYYPQG